MIRFYREKDSGDYLVVEWDTRRRRIVDARATTIDGQVGSVQGTTVEPAYLRTKCRAVPRAKVPKAWLQMLIGGNDAR